MQITKELIERYHQGLCSPEECDRVEEWLESDEVEMSFPENRDLQNIEDKGWNKLSARYHIESNTEPETQSVNRLSNYRIFWQLAASIVVVLGIATFYYTVIDGKMDNKKVFAYRVVKTNKGQRLNVTLSDGTVVWLNSESVLRFPKHFTGQKRELEFSGEGYFSVAKDPSRPFIIHTSETKVQVLGTKFNLRARQTEKTTSVVVEEGKVRFSGNSIKQQLILTANKRGVFEINNRSSMKLDEVYTGKYLAWKNNELVLDNVTMEEAVSTLERWFNVDIKISNQELGKERYTGSFSNPTLEQILESMRFAVKFRQKEQGKTIILY